MKRQATPFFLGKAAFLLLAAAAAVSTAVPATRAGQATTVAPIEVPVRVFDGGKFVDGLKLGDFEVLEDGYPVSIDTLTLIKGRTVVFGFDKDAYGKLK